MKDAAVELPKKAGWYMCESESGTITPSPYVVNMSGERGWLVELYRIKVVRWRELTEAELKLMREKNK